MYYLSRGLLSWSSIVRALCRLLTLNEAMDYSFQFLYCISHINGTITWRKGKVTQKTKTEPLTKTNAQTQPDTPKRLASVPKPSKFSELPRNTGGLYTARASCIWDQSPGKRTRIGPALGADVSSRESSCAGRPYRYCAQCTRRKRHKWLPAVAGRKYHVRETW